MEFKIAVDELQSVFSKLVNVVRANDGGVPGMILMEADKELKFKTTDGNVTLSITAEQSEVIEKGKALVRFRDIKGYIMKFVPLVDNYGTKDFHFISGTGEGLIKTKTEYQSGRPSYKKLKFQTFKSDMFPKVKSFRNPLLIINSSILKKGISKVLHCVNPDEVRKAMTGLKVEIKEDRIVFAGTNGVKLSEFEYPINAKIDNKSYIFMFSFASTLRNVLDDDAQVFMKFEGNYAYVSSNNIYLIGSLIINESYPNYKPMFDLERDIDIPRLDFHDSVHTIMDVLDPEDNNRVSITFRGKELKLKNDKVESTQEFEEDFSTELDVDINGHFLESIIRDFTGDNIGIHFTPGENYLVFTSDGDNDHTTLLTVVKRR